MAQQKSATFVEKFIESSTELSKCTDATMPPWASRRGRGSRRVGFDELPETPQQAKQSEAERVLDTMNVDVASLQAADVVDYFEVKALIDFLPQACIIPAGGSAPDLAGPSPQQSPRRTLRRLSVGAGEKHHWATSHPWQLFLREVSKTKASTGIEGSSLDVMDDEFLASIRQRLLESVVTVTGTDAQVYSPLHLQVHGFLRDKAMLPLAAEHDEQERLRSQFHAFHALSEGDEEENRSVVSSNSQASRTSRRGNKNRVKVGTTAAQNDGLWIALKGLVFKINLETGNAGRNLFYKTVLGPVYSGKECTMHFASNMIVKDAEFPSAKRGTGLGYEGALEAGSDASMWSTEVKEHINRIFCLFLQDFTLIGEMTDSQHLWF